MKRIAILTALILAAVSAFGQAARVDIPLLTSGPFVPITEQGPLPQALWVANSAAYLCTHPSATLAACQAAPITTYTDSTEGTTCPTATPLVQLPGNTCTAATGTTANVGFWYGGGVFDYWIVSSYGTYGPFSGNSSYSALPSSCGNPTGIPCGGTSATTAAGALSNLGAASLTANNTLSGTLTEHAHSAFGQQAQIDYEGTDPVSVVANIYETTTSASGLDGLYSEIDWSPASNPSSNGAPSTFLGNMFVNLDQSGTSNTVSVSGGFDNFVTNLSNTVEANFLNAFQSDVLNAGNGSVQTIEANTFGAGNNGTGSVNEETLVSIEAINAGSGPVSSAVMLNTDFRSTGGATNGTVKDIIAGYPILSGGATISELDDIEITGCAAGVTLCKGLLIAMTTGTTNYGIYQTSNIEDYTYGDWVAQNGFAVGTATSPIMVIPSTATGNTGVATGKVSLVPGTEAFGYSTLSSGTVTVSNAAACTPSATCIYKLTNCAKNSSTGIGTLSVGTVVSGTSFVINSLSSTATVLTTDASSVCWQIN